MSTCYVQCHGNDWLNDTCYSVAKGLFLRKHEVIGFRIDQLKDLPLTKNTVVFGEAKAVREALKLIGARLPYPESYPNPLRRYMDRSPSEPFLSDIRAELHAPGFRPVFVKPSRDPGLFEGRVISMMDDFLPLAHLPPKTLVWRIPAISFVSEFRVFVHHGDIVGVKHYAGDPLVFPDPPTVKRVVTASKSLGYVSYGIDIGVAIFPERPELVRTPTLVVKFNDSHSLESYGLDPYVFASMVEDRWNQMVGL